MIDGARVAFIRAPCRDCGWDILRPADVAVSWDFRSVAWRHCGSSYRRRIPSMVGAALVSSGARREPGPIGAVEVELFALRLAATDYPQDLLA